MKKKNSPIFECQHCGSQVSKWSGKCTNCGSWDSFVELGEEELKTISKISQSSKSTPTSIVNIKEESFERFLSHESEFDLVLGGGIVSGSLVLIGGSPGVGKSTLLLKVAGNLAKNGKKVLYVSGEESLGQIKLRANRLEALHKSLYLLSEIKIEDILSATKDGFEFLIVDSIQTIYSENISSAPGSVSQVRECTFKLMRFAKERDIATFIIGHITKEGSIAGPRILEHMVDTVLYFEGDSSKELRFLRGFKNRFGSTSEVGIFKMESGGLISAKDGISFFDINKGSKPGVALSVVLEGSRPIVVEIQALVSASGYGAPKRSATGFENSRLIMLLALLEKKLELPFNEYDVYINVLNGIKISETAADLAVIAAIISSFRNRAISAKTVFLGEVSLIGLIRDVSNIQIRLKEAKTNGFEKAIIPSKPKEESEIKCYIASEVSKIVDWM